MELVREVKENVVFCHQQRIDIKLHTIEKAPSKLQQHCNSTSNQGQHYYSPFSFPLCVYYRLLYLSIRGKMDNSSKNMLNIHYSAFILGRERKKQMARKWGDFLAVLPHHFFTCHLSAFALQLALHIVSFYHQSLTRKCDFYGPPQIQHFFMRLLVREKL